MRARSSTTRQHIRMLSTWPWSHQLYRGRYACFSCLMNERKHRHEIYTTKLRVEFELQKIGDKMYSSPIMASVGIWSSNCDSFNECTKLPKQKTDWRLFSTIMGGSWRIFFVAVLASIAGTLMMRVTTYFLEHKQQKTLHMVLIRKSINPLCVRCSFMRIIEFHANGGFLDHRHRKSLLKDLFHMMSRKNWKLVSTWLLVCCWSWYAVNTSHTNNSYL